MDVKLNSFAHYTHTIGNFCLVPAYYNGQRNLEDYWDAGLARLKYIRFVGTDGWGRIQSDFRPEMFIKYINTFFLWDYVVGNTSDLKYEVKSLIQKNIKETDTMKVEIKQRISARWKEIKLEVIDILEEVEKSKLKKLESKRNPATTKKEIEELEETCNVKESEELKNLKKELEELIQLEKEVNELQEKTIENIYDIRKSICLNDIQYFLTNAEYCIKRRSIFMVAMLDIATNHEDIYKKIQDQVFLTNDVYSGYDQVFNKIRSILMGEVNGISQILDKAEKQINQFSL